MRRPRLHRASLADSDQPNWGDCDDPAMAALLERYAEESLSPDETTLSRMGGVVRAAFVESAVERDAGLGHAASPLGEAPGGRSHSAWSGRRALAAFCAVAILTLSTFGFAAAESGPGQPFYRIRLGIETVNQPPAGSQDRAAADLARADARLNEIASSTGGSDWNAAADAAGAYRETLTAPGRCSGEGADAQGPERPASSPGAATRQIERARDRPARRRHRRSLQTPGHSGPDVLGFDLLGPDPEAVRSRWRRRHRLPRPIHGRWRSWPRQVAGSQPAGRQRRSEWQRRSERRPR